MKLKVDNNEMDVPAELENEVKKLVIKIMFPGHRATRVGYNRRSWTADEEEILRAEYEKKDKTEPEGIFAKRYGVIHNRTVPSVMSRLNRMRRGGEKTLNMNLHGKNTHTIVGELLPPNDKGNDMGGH